MPLIELKKKKGAECAFLMIFSEMDFWNVITIEDKTLNKTIKFFWQDGSFKKAELDFACVYTLKEACMTGEELNEIWHYFYLPSARNYGAFIKAKYFRYERCLNLWETVIEKYVRRILKNCNELPGYFKDEAKEWINRHIHDYLSHCLRLEMFTELLRCFFVDFVTNENRCTESGMVENCLDKTILTRRLIEDDGKIIFRRYRISCTCLAGLRRLLWRRQTPEEGTLRQKSDPLTFKYRRSMFWSCQMNGGKNYMVNGEVKPWGGATEIAVYDANVFALRESRENMQFYRQELEAFSLAFRCFSQWKICKASDWIRKLLALGCYSSSRSLTNFYLPIEFARMMSFLFKDIDGLEEFEELTKRKYWDALIYFLFWSNSDYFLSAIKLLQSFKLDESLNVAYLENLSNLVSRHQAQQELTRYPQKIKINCLHVYRSALQKFWDGTPEKYKWSAFKGMMEPNISKEYRFFIMLLGNNSFLEEDDWLLIRYFRNATVRERKVFLMSSKWKKIFVTLVLRENWSLLDWFTKASFDEDGNAVFRHLYMISSFVRGFCFDLLLKSKETVLNDLICWSLKSEDERRKFKRDLIHELPHIDECLSLISDDNFLKVERIINFCLEPSEIQDFKKRLANEDAFYSLILNHEWVTLDKYVAWCFETKEEIDDFKKFYFSVDGVDIYFHFVFREYLYDIERFYRWFDLSPEEIENLKKDTVFSFQSIDYILELLYSLESLPVLLLLWSLKDETMIIDWKSKVENHLLDDSSETNMAKYKLHSLVEQLLTLKGIN